MTKKLLTILFLYIILKKSEKKNTTFVFKPQEDKVLFLLRSKNIIQTNILVTQAPKEKIGINSLNCDSVSFSNLKYYQAFIFCAKLLAASAT